MTNPSCSTGYFAVKKSGAEEYFCTKCPDGCSTCSIANSADPTSLISCLTCSTGYTLDTTTKKCKYDCPSNAYYSTTILACLSCDISCLSCTGPTNANCTKCASKYKLDTTTGTCKE